MLEVIFPIFFSNVIFHPFYGLFALDLMIIFTIHSKFANFFSSKYLQGQPSTVVLVLFNCKLT